jgi:DNA-binding MarR family transcriptional regulator
MVEQRAVRCSRERVEALTRLVLGIFRANGELLAAGDRFTATLGLSSARFQVLGAIALSAEALTVPAIARSMGLTRQGVQKQVDQLVVQRLVVLDENPGHRRSSLVRLTPAGQRAFGNANRRWRRLATRLVGPHSQAALTRAAALVDDLGRALALTSDAHGARSRAES